MDILIMVFTLVALSTVVPYTVKIHKDGIKGTAAKLGEINPLVKVMPVNILVASMAIGVLTIIMVLTAAICLLFTGMNAVIAAAVYGTYSVVTTAVTLK